MPFKIKQRGSWMIHLVVIHTIICLNLNQEMWCKRLIKRYSILGCFSSFYIFLFINLINLILEKLNKKWNDFDCKWLNEKIVYCDFFVVLWLCAKLCRIQITYTQFQLVCRYDRFLVSSGEPMHRSTSHFHYFDAFSTFCSNDFDNYIRVCFD